MTKIRRGAGCHGSAPRMLGASLDRISSAVLSRVSRSGILFGRPCHRHTGAVAVVAGASCYPVSFCGIIGQMSGARTFPGAIFSAGAFSKTADLVK